MNGLLRFILIPGFAFSILSPCAYSQQAVVKAYIEKAEESSDIEEKTKFLKLALKETEALGEPPFGPLFLLGVAELRAGDEDKAEAYFDEAIRTTPNENLKAVFNSKTGNAYVAAQKLSKALPYYKAAVVIREKINPPGDRAEIQAQALKDLANCQRDLGNEIVAESIYKQAIAIAEQAAKTNPKAIYHIMTNKEGLAKLKVMQKKPEEAIELAREALGFFTEKGNFFGRGSCLFILGEARRLEGAAEESIALYQQAIKAYDSKGELESSEMLPLLQKTAAALEAEGDSAGAKKLELRIMAIREEFGVRGDE